MAWQSSMKKNNLFSSIGWFNTVERSVFSSCDHCLWLCMNHSQGLWAYPSCFWFLWHSAPLLWFLRAPLFLTILIRTGRHQLFNVDGHVLWCFCCGEALAFWLSLVENTSKGKSTHMASKMNIHEAKFWIGAAPNDYFYFQPKVQNLNTLHLLS